MVIWYLVTENICILSVGYVILGKLFKFMATKSPPKYPFVLFIYFKNTRQPLHKFCFCKIPYLDQFHNTFYFILSLIIDLQPNIPPATNPYIKIIWRKFFFVMNEMIFDCLQNTGSFISFWAILISEKD